MAWHGMAWCALKHHCEQHILPNPLKQVFTAGGNTRFEQLSRTSQGLFLDLSKQRLTPTTMELLIKLAEQQGITEAIEALCSGGQVNRSELRLALHTALRSTSAID